MTIMKNFLLIMTIAAFSSCSLMKTQITPAQKSVIMKIADGQKFKSAKSLPKSRSKSMFIRKGQWTLTLNTMKDGSDISLVKTKIIKATKREVIIEVETQKASDGGKLNISQMTIQNYPRQTKLSYSPAEAEKIMNNVKVSKIVNKGPDGKVTEIPAQIMIMTGGMATSALKQAVSTGIVSKKGCKTSYIKSSRCYSYPIEVKIMGFSNKAHVTAHSRIPINAQVRMEDEYSITEVIAFGTRGAKSSL
ncbi:MAG: hypothetical protein KAG61_04150 [Bacteriovoracaceae bacterium]|nr:hypothetical protein [Bacteriovoracaceae bacterium]